MGQAPAEVKEAADAVTAPVAEDGLAVELSRWF
jgi:hydroxymethylpyrimidine pyrophosphatase-like HAD family hydrolase